MKLDNLDYLISKNKIEQLIWLDLAQKVIQIIFQLINYLTLSTVNKILALERKALIIAGDLNLDWEDPEDRSLLEAFMKDLGLIHSGKRAQTDRKWPILEYIFYRNGRTSTFEVLETGEDLAFQNSDGPLSDHPALFIKLLIY